MNTITPSATRKSEHEVDRLLRGFFQAAKPQRWPEPPAMALTSPARTANRSTNKSRWALAACIALLLGLGGLVLRSYHQERVGSDSATALEIARPPHKKTKTRDPHLGPDSIRPKTPTNRSNLTPSP